MNVIPCTTWVRKGVAAAVPDKVINYSCQQFDCGLQII